MERLTFAEWLFGDYFARSQEDIVAKFKREYSKDITFPLNIVSLSELQLHLLQYLTHELQEKGIILFAGFAAVTQKEFLHSAMLPPVEEYQKIEQEIQKATTEFNNKIRSTFFAAKVVWADYEKYLKEITQ